MAETKTAPRLTESLPGRLAGWLLAVLWIFSMSGVDANAFSSFPVCMVLCIVAVLVAGGICCGMRVVRMSWPGWLGLAIGGYFLLRCVHSYALVDSWCEAVLILGAFAYYIAGVYAAQNRRYTALVVVLAAALLLNVLAFWVVRQPWFCLEWTGRAAQTPAGPNSQPTTLFVYKNFAGVFLSLGGCVLALWGAWGWQGWRRTLCLLLGVAAVAVSLMCQTRAVYLVLPLCGVGAWAIHVLQCVFSGRKLGGMAIVLGGLLLMLLGLALYEIFFGYQLQTFLSSADSHLRYLIWGSICEVLPSVPLWGCGANVTQWEIVPFYSEWQLPNYAHNEYLQAWVDYGLLGVVLVLLVLVLHVVQGLRCMASEHVEPPRRLVTALAVLVLLVVAIYAVVDFPWHSFALVAMCAFACGVLASPFACSKEAWWSGRQWAAGSHAAVVGVRAQKWPGRVILLALLLGMGCWSASLGCKLYPAWAAQWRYNDWSAPGNDDSGKMRRGIIAALLPQYPSPALMDTYAMLPPAGQDDLPRRVELLKCAHAGNPRQLFTVAMLVDALGSSRCYAEAELLMRAAYVGEAMPASLLNNWPAYYAYNLLVWGRYEMQRGNHAKALSLLDYALKMGVLSGHAFNPIYRSGPQPWREHGGIKPFLRKLCETCERDVRVLRAVGTRPDNSWMLPVTPGGRPALYRSLVDAKQR